MSTWAETVVLQDSETHMSCPNRNNQDSGLSSILKTNQTTKTKTATKGRKQNEFHTSEYLNIIKRQMKSWEKDV